MPALSRTTPVNKEPDMPNDVNTEINAVQAGDRLQPEDLPAQHLDDKPGLEAQLQLKPQFLAPGYVGSQKLAGKTARLIEQEGQASLLIPGDVKDRDFCIRAVEDTVDEFGKLDVLVNNRSFRHWVVDFDKTGHVQRKI